MVIIMGNNTVELMLNGRKEKVRSHVLLQLVTQINNGYDYRKFCIVEGSTDEPFYSNISNIDLRNKIKYLYNDKRAYDAHEEMEVGKDAVISSYNMIRKNHTQYLDKCIFIIDRDYDGAKSMHYCYDIEREKRMSITPGYSFENMFLEEENVKIIFSYLKRSNKELKEFERKYKQFLEETKEYFRLKATIIEVKKKGTVCYQYNKSWYKKKLDYSEIFTFNFDSFHYADDYFNRCGMEEEIKSMRQFVERPENKNAFLFYNKYSEEIVANRDMLRGHDALNFLSAYLRDIFGIVLTQSLLNSLTRKINIRMTFVNGLGKNI